MKMKAPEGVTDISVAGANYRPDEKGLVEVDDAHAPHLFQFGFVDARAETAAATQTSEPATQEAPKPAADGKPYIKPSKKKQA